MGWGKKSKRHDGGYAEMDGKKIQWLSYEAAGNRNLQKYISKSGYLQFHKDHTAFIQW